VHQGSGKKMPPRPIIAGAIVGWLEKALPEWATAVRKMMWNVYDLGLSEHDFTGVNVLDSAVSEGDEVSPGVVVADIVAPINAKIDSPQQAAEKLQELRRKLQAINDYVVSGDDLTPKFLKYARKTIHELGSRLKVDPKRMGEFEDIILSGKAIKWD
jgi:hypothetical protein